MSPTVVFGDMHFSACHRRLCLVTCTLVRVTSLCVEARDGFAGAGE